MSGAMARAARMLAWRVHVYGGERAPALEEARVPPLLAPDQLLVRVHAASLNPLDVAMIGGYGRRVLNTLRALEPGGGGVEFPLVAGRDFVGRVQRAGPAARLRPGQRVWGVLPPHWPGAHQQYVVARDRWAGEAPAALPDAQAGGALYAALTACAALRAAGLPPGERHAGRRVLLLGLGGVGGAALRLLAAADAHVAVGCSADACAAALAAGAREALDRGAADYGRRLEDGGPYDAILDCAGLGGREAGARRWRFARYVTLTTPLLRDTDERGALLGSAAAAAELLGQSCAAARPHWRAWPPPHVRWAYFAPSPADIELLRRLAERGQFEVAVERVFPWRAAAEAYARQAAGHLRGKLVLDFTDHRDHHHGDPAALEARSSRE